MTGSTSTPHANEALLAQILLDRERSGPEFQLEVVLARYPEQAQEIREFFEAQNFLDRASPALEPGIPTRLGDYRLIREVAKGGMGEVYEAIQESLGRRVAVKIIRRGHVSPEAKRRFLREQTVLARLHQTNIVPIHAAGEEGTLQYFVMPFIDGTALNHVIRTAWQLETPGRHSKTPELRRLVEIASQMRAEAERVAGASTIDPVPSKPEDGPSRQDCSPTGASPETNDEVKLTLSDEYYRSVAQTMADVAEALNHAHEARVLHRDVKPSNIMIDKAGQCWIIDFGLAGFVKGLTDKSAAEESAPGAEALTAGDGLGTPQYMAPEQFDGQADPRSDVWGLGVTLYELLTLRRAFSGAKYGDIRTKVQASAYVPSAQLIRNLPKDLDAICRKAVSREPDHRYQTPRAFADDLRRWLNWEPTAARPARTPRRVYLWACRNRGWTAAILAILFAIVATSTIYSAAAFQIAAQNEAKFKEAQRENLIRQAQGLRMDFQRQSGWFERSWKFLGDAAHVRADDQVCNEAATSLIGLDAVSAKEFRSEGACALAFHSSGKKLILGAQPSRRNGFEPRKQTQPIRIWDQEAELVKETKIIDVGPVAYDQRGKPVALTVKTNERALILWDLETETPLRELTLPQKTTGQIVEWLLSSDGATAAARVSVDNENNLIVAWDTTNGNPLRQEEKKTTSVMALSPDGKFLAAGDGEGRVEVWSLTKKEPSVSWKTGRLGITALAFGANLRRSPGETPWVFASGNQGGSIALWDLADHSIRGLFQGSAHDVMALEFSPDGVLLASSGRSEPHLWNVATGKIILELPFHDYATSLAFSPQGDRLAIANAHSPFHGLEIQIMRLENGRGLKSFHGLSGQIEFVEFSKDGSRLAALSHQWEVGVWDAKSGRLLHVFQPRPGLWVDNAGIALSDDNRLLAFTTSQKLYLWDLQTAKEQSFSIPPGMVQRLAYHGVLGKFLAFQVETRDAQEWPLRAKSDFRQHPRVGRIRAFSPAGFETIAEIKDFNKSVVGATMARNASVISVDGFADGRGGLTRKVRAYSLPDCKELWSDSSSAVWSEGVGLPLDPEGKVLCWSNVNDVGTLIRPRLVETTTGHSEDWPFVPLCLSPKGRLALARDFAPITGRTQGVSLHLGPKTTPLASFATKLSSSYATQFSRQGSHFAFGTTEGNVILCEIAATQAKLAELRLGW